MISFRLRHILPLALAVFLTGCSASSDEPQPSEWDSHTYLQLSVSTAESSSPRSRAEGDETTFEPGVGNELIKTMRFIVLDNDGKVEHNIMVYNTTNSSSAQTGVYIVKPNELKQIYLVGNEESLPESVRSMLRSLSYKDVLPVSLVQYVLERDKEAVSYTADQPIPMTEFFNFRVDKAKYDTHNKPVPYSADLFVTRIATKFTVNLTLDKIYSDAKFIDVVPDTLTISPIATRQFLFPHDMVYKPAKPDLIEDGVTMNAQDLQRDIESYAVPQEAPGSAPAPYKLTAWTSLDDTDDGCRQYTTGSFYLMESAVPTDAEGLETPYTISLNIDGATLTAPLPNLPRLPRNTHVVVNLTVTGITLNAEVDLMPYIGIELTPEFGFNDIKPRPTTAQ
ncbi:MAG: hypothetical protein K2M57_03120 [Paramuribaculum sp.]|nr:hypothetical protein [Paramuribaculum sp.]